MARVAFWEGARRVAVAIAWVAGFAVVGILGSVILHALTPVAQSSPWWLAARSANHALAFLAATWLVGWKLNRRTWEEMGWRGSGRARGLGVWFPRGAVIGALMAVAAIGLAFVASGAAVALTGDWHRWLPVAVPLLVGLACAALFEELLFRGYPLRRLSEALGPGAAIVVLVVPFGLLHLANPNATAFGTINVMLAGVWLAFAFFSAGGMAQAWGLHFGWNGGLAALFDAPVSGLQFQVPAVEYRPGAHGWVDGGAFGPEGGLVATLVMLGGTLVVLGRRLPRPGAWLRTEQAA